MKKYTDAEFELIAFEAEDVITTSGYSGEAGLQEEETNPEDEFTVFGE